MLFNPKDEARLAKLEEQLQRASAITTDLMSGVMAQACTRLAAQNPAAKAKLHRLIESGAWTDATFALVELELPQWTLRRLVYEDGEWLCSLSRQPQLPIGFDELVEARHENRPLAILTALIQAKRSSPSERKASATAVPQVQPMAGSAVCCDNFA